MHVRPHASGVESSFDAAVITSENFVTVKQLIEGTINANPEEVAGKAPAGALIPAPASAGSESSPLAHQPILIGAEGAVQGQVSMLSPDGTQVREVTDLTVYFVRQNEIVTSVKVESSGAFTATGLTSGSYAVVGAGKDGIFAIAVDLVPKPKLRSSMVNTKP